VRGDIVQQLHLKNAACYVASFNPAQPDVRVAAKTGAYEQILSFIQARAGDADYLRSARRRRRPGAQTSGGRRESACRITPAS